VFETHILIIVVFGGVLTRCLCDQMDTLVTAVSACRELCRALLHRGSGANGQGPSRELGEAHRDQVFKARLKSPPSPHPPARDTPYTDIRAETDLVVGSGELWRCSSGADYATPCAFLATYFCTVAKPINIDLRHRTQRFDADATNGLVS
jgi:hypothetical protein